MDGGVVLGDDAEHLGSSLQVLDDDDADVVLGTMDQELRNIGLGHGPFLPQWRAACFPHMTRPAKSYIRLAGCNDLAGIRFVRKLALRQVNANGELMDDDTGTADEQGW